MIPKRVFEMVFVLLLLIGSFWVIVESYQISIGHLKDPGPGFLLFYGAILLGLLSLINFVKLILNRNKNLPAFPTSGNLKRLFYMVISVAIAVLLFETIGYVIISTLLMIFLVRFIGRERWMRSLVVTGLMVILSYFVFSILLKIQLPMGPLGF
jgi:putative tricarboxylic transport membrane protein